MGSHAYPQTGAGPSSYYQQSPPPHHVYGNHGPSPRANYHYSYSVPPPPHLNSHQPPQFQQSPSRGSHRHNVGSGAPSYASRGAHHYHNYHPTQHHQQQQFLHSHVSPQLGPHPQQQHIPYSPQSVKYNHNQPYPPSYHYPSATAPVFTPSWQTLQPLSPLPKQLSMPPQNVQAFYEPSLAPPPGLIKSPQTPVVSVVPSSGEETKTEPPVPSTPTLGSPLEPASAPSPESPVLSQAPYTSTYSQMGTISTSDAVTSVSPPSSPKSWSHASPPRRIVVNPVAQWAIWSRRPQDPSHAPSIIISPRAHPPPDVVQQAIAIKTPPQSQPNSPPQSTTILPAVVVVQEETTIGTDKEEEAASTPQQGEDAEFSTVSSSVASPSVVWSSQASSTVPSSSVTEITDTPTVPGSPASSNTSLSLAGTPAKDVKEAQTKANEETVKAIATGSESAHCVGTLLTSAMPTAVSSSAAISGSSISSSAIISHEGLATTIDIPIQTFTPTSPIATHSASTVSVAPPSVTLTPANVKRSWADLLRPSISSTPSSSITPSSGATTRNALPTSSVVGFSIPAASASSSFNPIVPVSPSKKSELITLLTSGPSPNSMTAGTTIRPRGIVNSGNMCYANSVLQVLVYCPPFQKLFVELGKVLVGTAVAGSGSLVNGFGSSSSSASASGSTSAPINGLNGKEKDKDAAGMTPLIDATVEFLREFVDDGKTKSKAKKQVHPKKGSLLVNGSGGTSGVRGKGKEKETVGLLDGSADDDSEADWDACGSFLPTYLYDAMKLKKKFDHMRGGHQEDAEEFFGFYLETLEEELLSLLHAVNPPKSTKTVASVEEREEAAPPEDDGWMEVGKRNRTVVTRTIKATESPITRIFSGRFRTTVRAPGQKDSATVDDWNLLRLDIQRDQIHTIQDALSGISHPQSVQLTQAARPGVTIEGQQQSLIEVLPPILVLQMKRFGYDTTGVAKVGKQVRFGPELEIGPDLMVPAAKKAHPPRYKLFGALYHHGLSASGGHYTLDVLHPNRYPGSINAKTREGWVRIDDELVSDVRHEDVFGAYERDDARCAYLLFYRRI